MSSEMGHAGSKTKSLGQILEKPCIRSGCHFLSLIFMKIGQNLCLYEISDEVENGTCWILNKVIRSHLRKLCVHSRGHIFCQILTGNLVRMVALMKSWTSVKI